MPESVRDFFSWYEQRGKRVAAMWTGDYLDFWDYYVGEASDPIPPHVYLIEHAEAQGWRYRKPILVSLPGDADHAWINTYGFWTLWWQREFRRFQDKWLPGNPNELSSPNMSRWDQLPVLGTKPLLTESIYEEYTSKATSRARRLYLLAAFRLLSKYGFVTRGPSHNIASLLVADDGEVLSYGLNEGGYRHAEVCTLIRYFSLNPNKTQLPERCQLFTTLKPCEMCSRFIMDVWHPETKIWYGMFDTGPSGSTPLLGDKAKKFEGETLEQGPTNVGETEEWRRVSGTKPLQVQRYRQEGKASLQEQLERDAGNRRRGTSVADWLDTPDATTWFVQAESKFQGKVDKLSRGDTPVRKVLNYLKPWLG